MLRSMVIAILVGSLFTGSVVAAPVTVVATGTVWSTGGLSGFSVGQTFSLTYGLDPNAPDFNSGSAIYGDYRTAATNVRVAVGSYEATAPTGGVLIENNDGSPTYDDGKPDKYFFHSAQCRYAGFLYCDSVSGADVDGRFLYSIEMQLYDPTGTSLASDALPYTELPLAGFPATPILSSDGNTLLALRFATVDLGGSAHDGVASVKASITSLTIVPLPPPSGYSVPPLA